MRYLLLLLFTVIVGCNPPSWTPVYNAEQLDYLTKAGRSPERVTIANNQFALSWSRAQSFAARFSDTKIQTSLDYVVEAYAPVRQGDFAFKAYKIPGVDSSSIQLQAEAKDGPRSQPREMAQARAVEIFSYYVRTGEEPPAGILKPRGAFRESESSTDPMVYLIIAGLAGAFGGFLLLSHTQSGGKHF